jgi:hypothetical protein
MRQSSTLKRLSKPAGVVPAGHLSLSRECGDMAGKLKLRLSAEPDGLGFYYGWAERDGERVRVDIMPPEHLWRGDIRMTDHRPDPKA